MDCSKVGALIFQLRKEKGLTQRQLADRLGISNKTVSKWECGNGAPDLSLWEELSAVLGADILKLLQGELSPNRRDAGRIDKLRFYVCPSCGNILTSTAKAGVTCCGRRLAPLPISTDTAGHGVTLVETDGDYYVTVDHSMSKAHYICFAAWVCDDRLWFQRLYPEQSPSFRVPIMRGGGSLYIYCTEHGLFKLPENSLRAAETV